MLKPTTYNIITWWFAADTPIRHYKLSLSPILLGACQQVSQHFTPPSGATTVADYKRLDKLAFASAVAELIQSATNPVSRGRKPKAN
jgi:hypothetical protein